MADYLTFYGLKQKPFTTKADPRFFYLSNSHLKAIRSVLEMIGEKDGFSTLYGDYGLGKSTIAKMIENEMGELANHRVAVINSVGFATPRALLRGIADEFHMVDSAKALSNLIDLFNQFTLQQAGLNGQTLILIIDEAQFLKPAHLEMLREIINFEAAGHANLVQIVLIGTPELVANLKRSPILYKRNTCLVSLSTLDHQETAEMIEFRLNVAGLKTAMFAESAVSYVYKASRGVPRAIVKICARSIAVGAEAGHEQISAIDVKEAIDRYGLENDSADEQF